MQSHWLHRSRRPEPRAATTCSPHIALAAGVVLVSYLGSEPHSSTQDPARVAPTTSRLPQCDAKAAEEHAPLPQPQTDAPAAVAPWRGRTPLRPPLLALRAASPH